MQIRLWDKHSNYENLYKIANDIESVVKEGYKCYNFIIHQGSPFVQVFPTGEENIKCLYVNLEINFL